jgi:hypothetical protein
LPVEGASTTERTGQVPSTTKDATVVWLADWTNAESAYGPYLADWLRRECPDLHRDHPSIARALSRIDHQDHYLSFWTADRYITELNLHPAMAPLGTWSHRKPLGNEDERRKDREAKAQRASFR